MTLFQILSFLGGVYCGHRGASGRWVGMYHGDSKAGGLLYCDEMVLFTVFLSGLFFSRFSCFQI